MNTVQKNLNKKDLRVTKCAIVNKKYPGAYYPPGLYDDFFDLFHESIMHTKQDDLKKYFSQNSVDLNYLKALVLIGDIDDWNLALLKDFSAEAKVFYATALKIFYHINDPYFNAMSFPDAYKNILAYVTGKFLKAKLFPHVYLYDSQVKSNHSYGRQDAILDF